METRTPTVETQAYPETIYNSRVITTRYIGPTNYRPGRIRATSTNGEKITVSWNHDIGMDENHTAAAVELSKRLDAQYGETRSVSRIIRGNLPSKNAGFVFMFTRVG